MSHSLPSSVLVVVAVLCHGCWFFPHPSDDTGEVRGDTDTDAPESFDETCEAALRLTLPGSSPADLSDCSASLDGGFVFQEEGTALRRWTVELDLGQGSWVNCWVRVAQVGSCGPGMFEVDPTPSGSHTEVTMRTDGCPGVPNAYEGEFRAESGFIVLEQISSTPRPDAQPGDQIATTLSGEVHVDLGPILLSGTFEVEGPIEAEEEGRLLCLDGSGDVDGDGFLGAVFGGTDCDDHAPTVFPGAVDLPYDGVDADCRGDDDYDFDHDGRRSAEHGGEDCDDDDPVVWLDSDQDSVCDPADLCFGFDASGDIDNDGVCTNVDLCPLDPDNDGDGDGVCGNLDPCPLDKPDDRDLDGVCNSLDPCPDHFPDDEDEDGLCGITTDNQALLEMSVRYFGAQRCGDTGNWLLADNPHGDSCHLDDGPDFSEELDLTGGWHDAGDHIKFTRTIAFAAYSLLKAYETWPEAFVDRSDASYAGPPNGVPDVLDEVRIATDYLLRAHPAPNTLVARVGPDQDHAIWVTSPYQSTLPESSGGGQRPVYVGAKADVAGITAAALALMARVYEPYDAAHASACKVAAVSVYAYAKTHRGSTTTDEPFYRDNFDGDAMLCGATELYRTTRTSQYLTEAIQWDDAAQQHWWVFDWANNEDLCRHSLYLAGHTETLDWWTTDVASYLPKVTTDPHVAGLAWFADWGSLRYATSAAFSAALFFEATGEQRYKDFALSQLEWVKGDNEYNRSFVIGYGWNPPQNPHHRNAYGREVLDWDFSEQPLHELTGALVGGPTKNWAGTSPPGYTDDIEDYVGNEVSIVYNIGLVGTAAFAVSHEEPP